MKTLVVYDSQYGNTERIARAIGEAIAQDVRVLRVNEASPEEVKTCDLLIIGSPTHGGRPTPAIQGFLDNLQLNKISVTAFDTRFKSWWVKIFGFAAGRIASRLVNKGGTLIVPAEGFFVQGTRGPLSDGELERAAAWAKGMLLARKR